MPANVQGVLVALGLILVLEAVAAERALVLLLSFVGTIRARSQQLSGQSICE